MKRAQIQLEEDVYDQLRRRAFQQKKSISRLVRDIIKKEIAPTPNRATSINNFRFIAAGRSDQASLKPVSERHDEALAEAFKK